MSEAWIHFGILVFVQLLLFIVLVQYKNKRPDIKRLLKDGILIGIMFGLIFDLVFGKFLGLHSYILGFEPFFLFLNATLSYGLFSATILLFQGTELGHLFAWSFFVMAVYEISNLLFSVWTWEFSSHSLFFVAILSIGYFGGAVLVVSTKNAFHRHRLM